MVESATGIIGSEATMLMHQGIGLDRFNEISRSRAMNALFECCGNVTWSAKLAEARPYPDRDALLAKADLELLALSQTDIARAFEDLAHQRVSKHSSTQLARLVRERLTAMLGPSDGYPEY